jgi:hypothetical protein
MRWGQGNMLMVSVLDEVSVDQQDGTGLGAIRQAFTAAFVAGSERMFSFTRHLNKMPDGLYSSHRQCFRNVLNIVS